MKIAHIRKEKGKDNKTWLVMDVTMPGRQRYRLTISVNENKEQGSNQPDYYLWFNMNPRGQSIYKSSRVGALWNKVSKDGTLQYKDGYIEDPYVPGGKLNIAVFVAKPAEGETLAYTHEVIWNPPRQNSNDYGDYGYAEPAYTAPAQQSQPTQPAQQAQQPEVVYEAPPAIDINENDIPF